MIRLVTVVTLDWEFGEYFDIMDDWGGFDRAVQMTSLRVPELDPAWMNRIRSLAPRDPPIEVWKRA
jgi:hypothetical protein